MTCYNFKNHIATVMIHTTEPKNKFGTGNKSEGESVRGVLSCWYRSFFQHCSLTSDFLAKHFLSPSRIFLNLHVVQRTRTDELLNRTLMCLVFGKRCFPWFEFFNILSCSFHFLDIFELNDLYLRFVNWLLLFITTDRSPCCCFYQPMWFLLSTKDCSAFPKSLVINENKVQRKAVCGSLAGGQKYSSN